MAVILIKRRVEYCYISGEALRLQREAKNLSLRQLADIIAAEKRDDYIIMNGQLVALNKMTLCRMEHAYETALEFADAKIIQKILIGIKDGK